MVPALYFLSIVPAWIAGRPLMDLINIYMAQGAQDVWSLSIKWPNIYQIIGNQFFLLEYASAGTWLILGILMIILYAMAQKQLPDYQGIHRADGAVFRDSDALVPAAHA